MKILHICNCLRGGGIQNFLLSLLPEQVKQGHNVSLIVIEKYDYDYCVRLENILKKNRVSVFRLNKQRASKVSMLKTILRCRGVVKELQPDVVNTHGSMSHTYGAFATLGNSVRHVLTIHNAPEEWSIDTKILCGNKPMIFCSQSAFELRRQHSEAMVAIDNGISRDIVHSSDVVDLKEELHLGKNDKIIVLVGSMRPQKNYLFLKDIVKEANDDSLHFCICGGNYGQGYVDFDEFSEYPNIHCLGLRSDVSAIENGADLFLSCATFEGLPIAVLEAYFNGIPCVLSPIPQHQNICSVEKVWLPGDFSATAFVKTIYEALNNLDNHECIYQKRENQIEKYSISSTCVNYISFYQSVLNGK